MPSISTDYLTLTFPTDSDDYLILGLNVDESGQTHISTPINHGANLPISYTDFHRENKTLADDLSEILHSDSNTHISHFLFPENPN